MYKSVDGSPINYVLDTNVLLSDPKALYSFEENNVVLHFEVIREIEKFKKGNDEINANSREVLRRLRDHMSETSNRPIPLKSGGHLYLIKPNNLDDLDNKPYADSALLRYISSLEDNEKEKTILITEDNALYVMADASNIKAEVYLRQREGKKNLNEMLNLQSSIILEQESVNSLYKTGKLNIDNDSLDEKIDLINNQYLHVEGHKLPIQYQKMPNGDHSFRKLWVGETDVFHGIFPKNKEQQYLMQMCLDDQIQVGTVLGSAGTGKTLVTLASALHKTLKERKFERILIIRPVSQVGSELGFLPGDLESKTAPYMGSIYDAGEVIFQNMRRIFDRSIDTNGLDYLIQQDRLMFATPNFMRGRNLPNSYIIVDEAQNLSKSEIKTLVTRTGEGSKMILTGDPYQTDVPYVDEVSNGLSIVTKKFLGEDIFSTVILKKTERSKVAELASKKL